MGLISGASGALRDLVGGVMPLSVSELGRELEDCLAKAVVERNDYGFDPYGFEPSSARTSYLPGALMHRFYFRVESFDIDRVPAGRALLIANHAGQFAYDGAMLSVSMLLDAQPPRIARGMGEYFLFRLPWVGTTGARMGMMVGTPANCVHMLEADQCVMVFPEGARGANKPFHKRYQLQGFGQGFMRLALQTGTPIVPVGIVGSEEQQPGFANFEGVGRALGLPSLPITISSPWLGLLGPVFALPTKYRIHFGEPMYFEGDGGEEDSVVEEKVDAVKAGVAALIAKGLEERSGIFT
jgi:1-acyl-sn-glycerol-3-phosphate acyltransferase